MSLLPTAGHQLLWHDARVNPEWATTRLWEHIFKHTVFRDDMWIVSSQQPPTHKPGDLRRVDLVVERVNNHTRTIGTLLFMEAKRASASSSDITQVEYQAFTAACAYWVHTGCVNSVWAMTCVGTRARLWIYKGDDYLIPFIPSDQGLSQGDEYLEISTDGDQILQGLEYIKKHMVPPADLVENLTPSPRPINPTLPPNWHDDEVVQLDMQRQQNVMSPQAFVDPVDFGGAGPSSSAAGQLEPTANYGPDYENPGWTADQVPQETSAGQFDAGGYPEAGPSSEAHHGGDGRKEVEVKVTRFPHTFSKDELRFDRNGHMESSTQDDWVKWKRGQRIVWRYRHGKKTVYWTKKLG